MSTVNPTASTHSNTGGSVNMADSSGEADIRNAFHIISSQHTINDATAALKSLGGVLGLIGRNRDGRREASLDHKTLGSGILSLDA